MILCVEGCKVYVAEYDFSVIEEVIMIKVRIIKKPTESAAAEAAATRPNNVEKGLGRAILKKISPFPPEEDIQPKPAEKN
ncbi:hypothetical protein VI06_21370 [Aquitalea magnusonii]|nr:hypothetical protein VI06_21370 [Aquitalea magnusonii]